jgi:hypothetical protein
MATPLNTISRAVSVGIYDNCAYTARIYADKIIVTCPYVKWLGNTGGYAERKVAIRDKKIITAVNADLTDEADDSAWAKIGCAIGDEHLSYADF